MRRAIVCLAVLAIATPAFAAGGGSEAVLGLPVWLWKSANLAAFLFALWWFVGRPINNLLDQRRDEIGEQLAESERQLNESEEMRQQLMERLAAVEKEVVEMRERAVVEGEHEALRLREAAEAERERLEARIGSEISRREHQAAEQLAEEARRLTATLARELLEKSLTDADRSKVLKDALGAVTELQLGRN